MKYPKWVVIEVGRQPRLFETRAGADSYAEENKAFHPKYRQRILAQIVSFELPDGTKIVP